MQTAKLWFDANPILYGVVAAIVILVLVCGLISWMMKRSGQSLRPIVFFLVFMGIVGGPQLVYHLTHLKVPDLPSSSAVTPPPSNNDPATLPVIENDTFADLKQVFGDDVDPDLIRDAKEVFPGVLDRASVAQLAFKASGETVLAAVFPDEENATQAAHNYLQFFQLSETGGDEHTGWIAQRPSAQDYVRVIAAGRMLMAWTGADPEKLSGYQVAALGVLPTASPPEADLPILAAGLALDRMFAPWWMKAGGLVLNLAAAVCWFFWGTTWASSSRPAPGTPPVSVEELRSRLLSVNEADSPVQVEASRDGRTVYVTWRYADARWLDLARARGLRRTHRLSLRLDETHHTVKVREFWSEFDWSAGRGGADIRWKAAVGIMFFQYQHERVLGLQFGPDWKPTTDLTYSYTFNLQELKQPLIDAVVRSGWTWKPIMLSLSRAS
ncbi:MAG: hypothetical protein K1Y02_20295 [Candidatus Hydrogenedentes bacterium]|nr:hypothetical protein [Candidatus Hydrogenedentota bacterium]